MNKLNEDLKRQLIQLESSIKEDFPRIIAREGINFFENSFKVQGWKDRSLKKWKKRKEPKKFSKTGQKLLSYKKWEGKNKGRAILIGHRSQTEDGHLKDSLKQRVKGVKVIFSTDKIYAKVHNEGGRAGKGKGFKMPKRRFMGKSSDLNSKICKKFDKQLDKIFK